MSPDPDRAAWPYWSLDVPGLTRTAAVEIGTTARRNGVIDDFDLVDPSEACTTHLDRASVVALVRAIELGKMAMNEDERSVVEGLADWFTEWLEHAKDASPPD